MTDHDDTRSTRPSSATQGPASTPVTAPATTPGTTPDTTPDTTPGTTPGTSGPRFADTASLTVEETQPVTTSGTTTLPTYPTLPAAYTLDDDTPDPVPPAAVSTAVPAPADGGRRRSRLPRVRTVTFGLVALAISVLSLVALLTDVRLDGGVVGLGLLIGAGAALVAGGVAAALREARGGPGAAR